MGELLQEGPAAWPATPTPTSYLPECSPERAQARGLQDMSWKGADILGLGRNRGPGSDRVGPSRQQGIRKDNIETLALPLSCTIWTVTFLSCSFPVSNARMIVPTPLTSTVTAMIQYGLI